MMLWLNFVFNRKISLFLRISYIHMINYDYFCIPFPSNFPKFSNSVCSQVPVSFFICIDDLLCSIICAAIHQRMKTNEWPHPQKKNYSLFTFFSPSFLWWSLSLCSGRMIRMLLLEVGIPPISKHFDQSALTVAHSTRKF